MKRILKFCIKFVVLLLFTHPSKIKSEMKKLTLFIVLIMPFAMIGQGKESLKRQSTEEYCELKLITTAFNNYKNPDELKAEIRFSGNDNNKDKSLMDEDGTLFKVITATQVLNFMNAHGWKLITAWPIGVNTIYIMKREIVK